MESHVVMQVCDGICYLNGTVRYEPKAAEAKLQSLVVIVDDNSGIMIYK